MAESGSARIIRLKPLKRRLTPPPRRLTDIYLRELMALEALLAARKDASDLIRERAK